MKSTEINLNNNNSSIATPSYKHRKGVMRYHCLFTISALLLSFLTINGQSITGSWTGILNIQGQQLPMVIHIPENNSTTITLDSPEQGVYGIVSDSSTIVNNHIYISVNSIDAVVYGEYNNEADSIYCEFKQFSMKSNIVFGRGNYEKKKIVRKQDPTDFPYKQEEISITNNVTGVTLAGTLTMPDHGKVTKIVILISGSGTQNRNEELLNHRPFLVLSDYLTRKGIAVIRYDDRGCGGSVGGELANATSYDFSLDAESVVNYIKSNETLKDLSIGLIGHSEGGMIAQMIASRNNIIDFVVLLASPGIKCKDVLIKQQQDLTQMSIPGSKENLTANKKIMDIVTNNNLTNEEKEKKATKKWLKICTSTLLESGMDSVQINNMAKNVVNTYLSPWMQYFLQFDPTDYLKKIDIPVLALNGTKDLQVNYEANLHAIEKNLKRHNNNYSSTIAMEGLNHLFQKCLFGSPKFYESNEETFNENAMDIVATWINDL